jgi:hypothetical protein
MRRDTPVSIEWKVVLENGERRTSAPVPSIELQQCCQSTVTALLRLCSDNVADRHLNCCMSESWFLQINACDRKYRSPLSHTHTHTHARTHARTRERAKMHTKILDNLPFQTSYTVTYITWEIRFGVSVLFVTSIPQTQG